MGSLSMRTAISFVVLVLAMTGIWAVTEVRELGNDDSSSGSSVSLDADDGAEYDDMGEGVGFGRRASFLTTQGSFTLSSGSGTNVLGTGGGEELGEDDGVGFTRRASFLTTQGSFTLSSGSGTNVLGTGGGEELGDEYDF